MAKLTKKQEWAVVVGVCVVIAGIIGATYFLLTMDQGQVETTQDTDTASEEGIELQEIEADLSEIDDLDFSELDAIEEDLNATDLTELE